MPICIPVGILECHECGARIGRCLLAACRASMNVAGVVVAVRASIGVNGNCKRGNVERKLNICRDHVSTRCRYDFIISAAWTHEKRTHDGFLPCFVQDNGPSEQKQSRATQQRREERSLVPTKWGVLDAGRVELAIAGIILPQTVDDAGKIPGPTSPPPLPNCCARLPVDPHLQLP